MSAPTLQVGFATADITPPTGLYMCGGLDPRTNEGTLDPLQVKTLVAESQGQTIALVSVDLIGLPRTLADRVIAGAARQTGLAPRAILIMCSHTHNGPYTTEGLYSFEVTDAGYLERLCRRLQESIVQANNARQPATVSIGRSLVHHGQHNRRLLNKKDGKVFNSWMAGALDDLETCPQLLGSTGPIDPELWVLRFNDPDDNPLGLLFNLSLHTNGRGGLQWSADYPGVVARQVQEAFGADVITLYAPGACADINPTRHGGQEWQHLAAYIAHQTLAAARQAQPLKGPVVVNALRQELPVPRRDPRTQPPEAVDRLNWGGRGGRADVFDRQARYIAEMPATLTVPINAAHIGPFAIATNPGELFVEHGLTIKRHSPFPHTIVSELTNDLIMYQPTRQAFELQGYETLVGPNRVDMEGIEQIVETAGHLLEKLWQQYRTDSTD